MGLLHAGGVGGLGAVVECNVHAEEGLVFSDGSGMEVTLHGLHVDSAGHVHLPHLIQVHFL